MSLAILHVDQHDDPPHHERKLEGVDGEVERVTSEGEAMLRAGATEFAAIFIDGPDEEICRGIAARLRALPRARTTPIVLLGSDRSTNGHIASSTADAHFRTMFEQGAQFAGILSLDGTVVDANRICLDACGYSRADVIGKHFWECGYWSPAPWLADMIQQAFYQARDGTVFRTETIYFLADGSERIADLVLSPIKSDDGRVMFVVPTGTDITERRCAEERLRLLYTIGECARRATEPTEVMTMTSRFVGEHLRAARCAYADVDSDLDHFTIRAGLDESFDFGARNRDVHSLDTFGRHVSTELRAGRTVVVSNVTSELGSDGADAFIDVGVRAFVTCPLLRGDRLVAMMAVYEDEPRAWTKNEISFIEEVVERSWAHIERIRDGEAIREQDRRKDEFLATLAHELRNPLAPIRTGLEVLKRTANMDSPVASKARDIMDRQLGHMVRLIDDLLDVSRISRGKVALKRERILVRTIIDHALDASRPHLEAARHRLLVELPEHEIWVHGDLTRLAQVLSNLLNNAAKYTTPGGTIRLTVTTARDDVVVRVVDTGAGIPTEMLTEIFGLFAQASRTLDRAQGGLGIGLSLVRMLVEMHEGTVVAESEGLGKGSTFTVRLPIHRPTDEKTPASSIDEMHLASGRRILVIDDNVDGAETLALMLELAGHQTRTVHDGEGALAAAQEFAPDLVFLDIGLPGMNGYEVASLFRADEKLRNVMLIALTGFGGEDDKRRTQDAGFDLHLTKPVSCTAVEQAIAQAH